MTITWAVHALAFFVTTVGGLLTILHVQQGRRFADGMQVAGEKRAYEKHQAQTVIAVALLALWIVLQYLALVLL